VDLVRYLLAFYTLSEIDQRRKGERVREAIVRAFQDTDLLGAGYFRVTLVAFAHRYGIIRISMNDKRGDEPLERKSKDVTRRLIA
jgi:hypothetical protein